MRYSITINQLALLELESNISLEEAVLLDYLYWLCTSPSEEIERMRIERDGKKYTWFDYNFYIQETPILRGKTKGTITPKIKALEDEQFIETVMQGIPEKGSRKYVRLLEKCDTLFRKLNEVVSKTKQGSFRKLNVDNSIILDNSNIDNISKKKNSFSNIKDVTTDDVQEIAEKYKVSVGFVTLQLEKMENWCKAKGKRYKDYKHALRNWVLMDMQRHVERTTERSKDDKYRPVDGRNVK